ncbi:type II toxin-antitoxin system prevent-host-death family antitoxin [Streptomyces sp. NPDC086776]|uniref:type II toxin-antitoxin system prevent-host-death family antitoxin n=2 Tax=unclassified Streptomyces TaxID=2593676 RepID=UPI00380D00ED
MPANTSAEIGVRDLRTQLSDVLHESTVRGRITYVTSRGRRVAAIVPVDVAEAAEAAQQPGDEPSA